MEKQERILCLHDPEILISLMGFSGLEPPAEALGPWAGPNGWSTKGITCICSPSLGDNLTLILVIVLLYRKSSVQLSDALDLYSLCMG